jgi:hypothetical protein
MSDEETPNHELNLSRIQSGDFRMRMIDVNKINPILLFRDEIAKVIWRYDLKIQNVDWFEAGGKKPSYSVKEYTNEDVFFNLVDLKKALKENKNRLILSNSNNFSVPLTPQEVGKIHERIEAYQKDIAEAEAKVAVEREAAVKRREEHQKQYNENMDALRKQRQKLFENQENVYKVM